MEQQLIACARELFEGVPGSAQQKDANAWLMAFQTRDEAWQPALHVLQHPPRVHDHLDRSNMVATGRGQVLAAPVLVAMQIVRLKTVQEWTRMTGEQRQFVRDTLLSLLGVVCTNDKSVLTPAAFRIACVIIADIIVKSSREWSTWKHNLQQIVDASLAQKSVMGAIMYEEILASIPQQIVASMHLWTPDELQEVIASFKQEQEHVMHFARTVLSSIGILDPLLSVATCENEDMAQLAAEIIADALASISPELAGSTITEVVCYTAHRLLQTRPLIFGQTTTITSGLEGTDEASQTTICRGLSRIACSLAINHTATLLSREMNEAMTRMNFDATQDSFSSAFLEYLLGCSSHKDIEVMEPTLEFWFFFLDQSTKSGSLWHLLTSVTEQEHVVQLLGRLVNALIDHCRYPRWFVETQELTSDDADVEAITAIR
uniref:Importin N-terminal domain-containing protein n=1 Tax=Globisporangium ultimum (strain ATCC 200006 / CBS 805.95 / DAOM BR144) TaxID=431595 RepID=K3X4D1_GLOUD